jgi:hypothetical protein
MHLMVGNWKLKNFKMVKGDVRGGGGGHKEQVKDDITPKKMPSGLAVMSVRAPVVKEGGLSCD